MNRDIKLKMVLHLVIVISFRFHYGISWDRFPSYIEDRLSNPEDLKIILQAHCFRRLITTLPAMFIRRVSFHLQTVVFLIPHSPNRAMEIFLQDGKRYETKIN